MIKMDVDKPVYVCGPMSWKPKFNVPSFLEAQEDLKAQGYKVQLPADLDDPKIVKALMKSEDGNPEAGTTDLTWGDCLAMDVKLISDVCGGIAVLPGWNNSKGARLETFVNFLCRKPTVYYPSLRKVPKRVLVKAWLGDWYRPSRSGVRGFVV